MGKAIIFSKRSSIPETFNDDVNEATNAGAGFLIRLPRVLQMEQSAWQYKSILIVSDDSKPMLVSHDFATSLGEHELACSGLVLSLSGAVVFCSGAIACTLSDSIAVHSSTASVQTDGGVRPSNPPTHGKQAIKEAACLTTIGFVTARHFKANC
jgi:hypothetical protein